MSIMNRRRRKKSGNISEKKMIEFFTVQWKNTIRIYQIHNFNCNNDIYFVCVCLCVFIIDDDYVWLTNQ